MPNVFPDDVLARIRAVQVELAALTALTDIIGDGYVDISERTAPDAPAANTARVFAQDNGAGKTQLCVIFNTGAVQVIATQP